MILLDTNLLARITRRSDPQSTVARATRRPGMPPTGQNGLGMTTIQAGQWLRYSRRRFTFLPDRPDLPDFWQNLVEAYGVTGFRSHDVRLVAAMQSYGITRLLSFNAADFRGLPVTVIDPAAV